MDSAYCSNVRARDDRNSFGFLKTLIITAHQKWVVSHITACAVATNCCISDVPSQWEGRNFDPPQLPHFSTDLNETWIQERYPGYDPTCKIWLVWDDGKKICGGRAFSVTFYVPLSFFCILAHAYRHTRRPITTVYGSKRVFPRKVRPFGGLDDWK